MNNRFLIMSVLPGVLAAWLFIAPLWTGVFGAFASIFTAFPLFISVLGFGTLAGLISGATAAVIVTLLVGPLQAASLLCFTLGPALWIGYLVGLTRQEGDDQPAEWYPLDRILMWLAGISAGLTIFAGLVGGLNGATIRAVIDNMASQVAAIQASTGASNALTVQQVDEMAAQVAYAVPFAIPASLFVLLGVNLILAEKYVRARGWMLRPKDNLVADMSLPIAAVAFFAAGVLASFAGGSLGLLGNVTAGAFGAALAVVGLAVVHTVSMPWPGRSVLLTITYFALLISGLMRIGVIMIGLVDTIFGLRKVFATRSNNSNNNPNE